MGAINWLAVILSSTLAAAIAFVWYGPLFGGLPHFGFMARDDRVHAPPVRDAITAILLFAFSALMIGHALARIGPETLALKPRLYWMQTGGVGAFFVVPALWIAYARHGIPLRECLVDAGYWLVVYLAMGTVFWALS